MKNGQKNCRGFSYKVKCQVSAYQKKQKDKVQRSVFCEETYTTTINHLVMSNVDGREHTAVFIKTALNW